ncbi:hypothetical protein LDO31_08650 [Luteimonas sp. XNQY3]|nr:hypothetical protein [Luteimonas sp. XNQY3]MCD9006302.1 hypothetical protein [Luteimonas sp. XNQY3]
MNNQSLDGAELDAPRELHLHPVDGSQWIGVVYFDGAKQLETQPLSCIDAVKREVAKQVAGELKIFVWAQDGGMILSES